MEGLRFSSFRMSPALGRFLQASLFDSVAGADRTGCVLSCATPQGTGISISADLMVSLVTEGVHKLHSAPEDGGISPESGYTGDFH